VYDVEVELDACAYAFNPGQRMRVSIAGADWPNTAAPARPVSLTIHGGELELPVWSGPSPYDDPVLAPGGESVEDPAAVSWKVERDVLARTTSCVVDHGSTYEIPFGGTASEHYQGRVTVNVETFEQSTTATTTLALRWPDVEVSTIATMDVTISAESLDAVIELTASESTPSGEAIVDSRHWHQTFPREG
jgi:hypothetical protein